MADSTQRDLEDQGAAPGPAPEMTRSSDYPTLDAASGSEHEAQDLGHELTEEKAKVAELERELGRVNALHEEALSQLDLFRRAHEALTRRLVAERAAFADGIARIQAHLYGTRSWRYTRPLRAGTRFVSRLKS
jgi:chromosome segregation ATPase